MAQSCQLAYGVLNELLSSEAWIHTHQQHHVHIADNVFEHADRCGWVQCYTGFHSSGMNLLYGTVKVGACLDVHFMIVHPEQYIEQTAKAGAMMMNVHYEACTHLHRTIQQIHDAGMKAGVTLNPSTPVCVLEDIICDVDMVLLMSVNPGFGGQKFIENTIVKLARLRQLIKSSGSKALIEIDGGVQAETAPRLIEAGADILVSGSYVFKSKDPLATIHGLKTL